MKKRMPHMLRAGGVVLILLCAAHSIFAQLNQDCTVSVLNRTVQVNADGSWVLPNVPANFGQVKARATCVRNGVTISGESDYFTISANGAVNLPAITLGASTQIPTALNLAPANPIFTSAGQTIQLVVTAIYPDSSTRDVSAASTGTNYTSSNPAILTVNANGLMTAVASGTVIIQASNDGATGIIRATVLLSNVDSDGDGIPDDIEITLGLNPQNPVDAQEDFDRDGLTNLKEFQLSTNLRVFDTDGDGIGDGLEVQTGSNPLDPNSFNLAQALKSIKVTPTEVALTVNTIIGVATRQLIVTGTLIDGTSLNLTSKSRGTNYNSSDLLVANFGLVDGLVFAGNNGTATITVSNNGHSATVQVTVTSFAPTALSFVSIPGFANNVDISGNIAYVAAGSTGLQVVDVLDRRAPRIIGSLDTPGNANDVRVVGNRAYIADGASGLRIIDVTNPVSPVLLGALDTAGEANDVVVVGNFAYVADGPAGLQIIDVSDPVVPRLIATLDTPGTAKGVDVSGNIAVIADGSSMRTIDVSNPSSPVERGSLTTTNARDLTVEGSLAYVADLSASLRVIDFSIPTAPRLLGSTTPGAGGLLADVAKVREFVFGADILFVNSVPIVNVADPENPAVRARLDFPARDDNGTGIAVDNQFVYVTTDRGGAENGVNGDSRLYIGQYVALEDLAGIPPVVSIISPPTGITVVEGAIIPITVQATDDVQVASVDLLVNDNVVFTDSAVPYQFTFTAPAGATTLSLTATAVDVSGNVGTSAEVRVNVIPDPLTTIIGRVIDENSNPVSGATVSVLGRTGVTSANGSFSIPNVPTVQGNIVVNATFPIPDGTVLSGVSAPTAPVPNGVTNVGDIRLSAPFGLLISEFRLRGLSGANDEFVEIYNISEGPHTVAATDGSSGYALVASNGVTRFVIPNGTVIPGHGHFLGVNSVSYSLSAYPAGSGNTATGNATYSQDIADNSGLALFKTSNPSNFTVANRLDAVGATSVTNLLFKEGTGYQVLTPFSIDHSFHRKLCNPLLSTTCRGNLQDTDNNASDFLFVDTNGTSAGAGQRLGAPGPENLSSPGSKGSLLSIGLLDPNVGGGQAPNFVRNLTSDPANNSTFGTVSIRLRITNNSGSNITRLRFRVVDLTTFPAPSGIADLRPRSSTDITVATSGGPVTVRGTLLEQPPNQPNGGGFNSSMSVSAVTLATPLAVGQSVNMQFLIGVQQQGCIRFAVIAEALPINGSSIFTIGGVNDSGGGSCGPTALRVIRNPLKNLNVSHPRHGKE